MQKQESRATVCHVLCGDVEEKLKKAVMSEE
jgi:hypothetical protein